ncbi:hypothetical protein EZS27_013510 [termite gut metagenome]|uniref:Non-reducing end beta-L-arabinofuranosidase n=1 Tax=termite gut metagenome TaxID=433724 RepID=A0A5J4RX01_9ZZZZ
MQNITLMILVLSLFSHRSPQETTVVERFPVNVRNDFYTGNRDPFQPSQLLKLPVGSIEPGGWIRRQLELQKDGLCGHLGEISAWLQKENNAWLQKGGEWGWEEVPYWLRGYGDLAYLLGDEDMKKEAFFWVENILKTQREDGNFGPAYSNNGKQDFWPNMIALWIMQSYYEYTHEQRVIDFMLKYSAYQLTVPDEDFLSSYWENCRGGDNLWSVIWLYNLTGDRRLLELAEKIHRNTKKWSQPTLPDWHNVNIAQGVREPATYYLVSRDSAMLSASYHVQNLARSMFGQVPGGMFGADEVGRIGKTDPRQGTETCGFVEQMASDEIMLQISGDPYWADHCENVAFNSFPAALMPDLRTLRYITCPNHVVSDAKNHSPGIVNAGPFMVMTPFSSRCCQHNHGFGWSYYAEHLVMATPDNGLATLLYNSCKTTAKVGNGIQIELEEQTHYPFEEQIRFTLHTPREVTFPLYLRIPSWCEKASAKINGKKIAVQPVAGSYVRISRKWASGDIIVLNTPMKISTHEWTANKNSVSLNYGPLTLSLRIKESYKQVDSRETAIGDSKWQENADATKWPAYEIYPESAWNYALVMPATVSVTRKSWTADDMPFTQENSPLEFKARGRQVPAWTTDEYGLCGVLPAPDAGKSPQTDEITLIPMGAARLRISVFPTEGTDSNK